jgi:flavin-dependent dehydrogenase
LHKFQGWETNWSDNSPVFYLLVDVGTILDEIRAPGTLYAALSRPHTVGDLTKTPNTRSALYFIGNDVCFNRIKNTGLTKSGEPTAFVKSRNLWVQFLRERKKETDSWISKNKNIWLLLYENEIKNKSVTKRDLETKILQRIDGLKYDYI